MSDGAAAAVIIVVWALFAGAHRALGLPALLASIVVAAFLGGWRLALTVGLVPLGIQCLMGVVQVWLAGVSDWEVPVERKVTFAVVGVALICAGVAACP